VVGITHSCRFTSQITLQGPRLDQRKQSAPIRPLQKDNRYFINIAHCCKLTAGDSKAKTFLHIPFGLHTLPVSMTPVWSFDVMMVFFLDKPIEYIEKIDVPSSLHQRTGLESLKRGECGGQMEYKESCGKAHQNYSGALCCN
jgi:hypothetical protein